MLKTTRLVLFLGILLATLLCIDSGIVYAASIAKPKTIKHKDLPAFVPDQVVVAFKPGTPSEEKRSAHAQAGGRVISTIATLNVDVVSILKGKVFEKKAAYKRNPNVEYAEPNYYYTLHIPPDEGVSSDIFCDDYSFHEQWSLNNSGQGFLTEVDPYTLEYNKCVITGVPLADINWLEVWEDQDLWGVRGNGIKIAIVDTGVECSHPDLFSDGKCVEDWVAPSLAVAPYYVTPGDLVGHGTHVAGIAAASTNNGNGIAGVGINAKVGSLKACWCLEYLEGYGCIYAGCTDVAISEAILHAKDNGYHVINMSLGGPDSDTLRIAVEQALAAGMVLVASAGNSYEYNDISMSYPAAYPGVVAVAATDHYDNLASFSNFGSWVDVAAPGTNILSAYPSAGCGGAENCYSWMSGTSMASPIVAGAAALVLDKISGGSLEMSTNLRDDVIAAIRSNADHTGALGQNMLAWTRHGRLNLQAALTGGGENIPPVAAFTYICDGLTCDFDGSDSYDIDDGIATYGWDFGDGTTGSGVSATHAYLTAGTYTVSLTVTDNGGLTAADTAIVTVTEQSTLVMHVESIDMDLSTRTAGKNNFTKALAIVTIFDSGRHPVEGATVYGSWSGATSDSDYGVTDTNGKVTLESDSVKNPSGGTIFTFTVDDVVKSTGTYDSVSNIENSDWIDVQ
jgi:thermitase